MPNSAFEIDLANSGFAVYSIDRHTIQDTVWNGCLPMTKTRIRFAGVGKFKEGRDFMARYRTVLSKGDVLKFKVGGIEFDLHLDRGTSVHVTYIGPGKTEVLFTKEKRHGKTNKNALRESADNKSGSLQARLGTES
jgi:hypothetical protein